ncbi:MAG: hypothetical protein U0821_11395 [Chloroflexota bacterium]
MALSDFALAALNAFLTWRVWQHIHGPPASRIACVLFFGSGVTGPLLGGLVHGWLDPTGASARRLWTATLLSVGVTGFATELAAIEAAMLTRPNVARAVALGKLTVYGWLASRVTQNFALAIGSSAVAATSLLLGLTRLARTVRAPGAAVGLVGVLLAFLAAAIQATRFSLHSRLADHNTLYHLIQGGAMLVLYRSARMLLAARP